MADLFASHSTLLRGEGEGHEGGHSKLCVCGSVQVEGGVTGLQRYITETKRMGFLPREAKFARAHQKEERDPNQVCESQGFWRVESAEPAGDEVQQLHRDRLAPTRRGILLFVVLELPLEPEIDIAVRI